MERFNPRKYIRQRGQTNATAPGTRQASGRPAGKLPKIIASGVAIFLVFAVLASVFTSSRTASPAASYSPNALPVAQATAGMAVDALSNDMQSQTGGRTAASGGVIAQSPSSMKTPPDTSNAPATGGTGAANTQANKDWDRMIIRTATLQLKVKDVAASIDQVRTLAGAHAGYVTQSDSHQEGDTTVASITMQVPADQFDAAISQLRKAGIKVLNEQVSTSDVTEEYTDLNSQLRNLQATEQRILALTQKADKIEDILTLDRELRQIQSEIERIQGRVNFLSKRTQMSTITVSLYPDIPAVEPLTKQTAESWDPAGIASHAWNSSLELLANVGTLVITVAVFLWWTLPLLLIIWLLSRRYRRTLPPPSMAIEG